MNNRMIFNGKESLKKINRIAIKGVSFIVITVSLAFIGNAGLQAVSPYDGKMVADLVINKANCVIKLNNNVRSSNQIVLNDKFSQEDKETITEFINGIKSVFKNVEFPYLVDNINNLNIKVLPFVDCITEGRPEVATYYSDTNTIEIPDETYFEIISGLRGFHDAKEVRRDVLRHELWHVINDGKNPIKSNFGFSVREGIDAIYQFEAYGNEINQRAHRASQYGMRAIQEIIDPYDLVQHSANDNMDLVIEDLHNVYGNRLDAVRLISSIDEYAINHDALKNKDINYNALQIDILEQLYTYEKARITSIAQLILE